MEDLGGLTDWMNHLLAAMEVPRRRMGPTRRDKEGRLKWVQMNMNMSWMDQSCLHGQLVRHSQ